MENIPKTNFQIGFSVAVSELMKDTNVSVGYLVTLLEEYDIDFEELIAQNPTAFTDEQIENLNDIKSYGYFSSKLRSNSKFKKPPKADLIISELLLREDEIKHSIYVTKHILFGLNALFLVLSIYSIFSPFHSPIISLTINLVSLCAVFWAYFRLLHTVR